MADTKDAKGVYSARPITAPQMKNALAKVLDDIIDGRDPPAPGVEKGQRNTLLVPQGDGKFAELN